ncbi:MULTISPECIES: nitrate reductase molybdenum cofactor assembly chaperone [Lactobacillus]|uniref:Nitrate reductase molybdenum cofactor assembly chaperone n=1 Tax=Lactobacillus xujianguonis TaxID=2495899 RepID=A0A437SVL3_9LACO|nr:MULTISPECIES: nitrate reductase molybdenum cofactor assembly chaperone [Lactobacillus]RVU70964.1 nitrate reductase molybdenum cofactor assembly chaperone [Lactobacillus xujianguonis]RVU73417.1 nitrate reductase molybdenum cofactor assembly chaperone [Lactobacillus xujianguonis]
MINFERINQLYDVFVTLSRIIDYPDEQTFTPEVRQLIANNPALEKDLKEAILTQFDLLAKQSFLQQQSHYANLFEMNRRYTLYMSYYKMTDSRERGTIIAKLKMLYEMFGISETSSELADYLPMMLEFFAYADFMNDERKNDLNLALGVIEDGTYTLLKNAVPDADDPYMKLIRQIRNVIRSCIETEARIDA